MKKTAAIFAWLLSGLLLVLGLFFEFALIGYRVTALVCFGLSLLLICYQLLALLGKSHKGVAKALRTILTIFLCLGLVFAGVTGMYIANASSGSPDADCDYVIVLGAGVNGSVPSLILRNRLDAAYRYLTAHPDAICIVSGGQGPGEAISEAQCMYDDLTKKGIDANRIWMEDKATSTRENLKFSLALIEANTGSRPAQVGVLSNEFHLYRAGLFAQEQGITAVGISAKTSLPVLHFNYFIREIVAVWFYVLLGG